MQIHQFRRAHRVRVRENGGKHNFEKVEYEVVVVTFLRDVGIRALTARSSVDGHRIRTMAGEEMSRV